MQRLLLLFVLSAMAACAADLTGKWSGTFNTKGPGDEERSSTAYMNLKVAGQTVTGTAGPNEGEQMEISNGKIDGDKVTFDVVRDNGLTLKFQLKFEGETLSGDARAERDGQTMTAKIALKRQA